LSSTEWIRSKFLISLMVFQLDFPNNPFRQFPKTHYSSPALAGFQHSNWGEAPKFVNENIYISGLFWWPLVFIINVKLREIIILK